jgi:hypothetical protein
MSYLRPKFDARDIYELIRELYTFVDDVNVALENLRFEENFQAALVSASFTALNTAVSCAHNLGTTDVGWIVLRVEHSNAGAGSGDVISVVRRTADAVSTSAIELRAFAAGSRTVDGSNPINAVLLFYPL